MQRAENISNNFNEKEQGGRTCFIRYQNIKSIIKTMVLVQ